MHQIRIDAVILLYHAMMIPGILWMDVGTAAKNSRRYINITAISGKLGLSMCKALPGFHYFTGSDYTSALVRKGKGRLFEKLA